MGDKNPKKGKKPKRSAAIPEITLMEKQEVKQKGKS